MISPASSMMLCASAIPESQQLARIVLDVLERSPGFSMPEYAVQPRSIGIAFSPGSAPPCPPHRRDPISERQDSAIARTGCRFARRPQATLSRHFDAGISPVASRLLRGFLVATSAGLAPAGPMGLRLGTRYSRGEVQNALSNTIASADGTPRSGITLRSPRPNRHPAPQRASDGTPRAGEQP